MAAEYESLSRAMRETFLEPLRPQSTIVQDSNHWTVLWPPDAILDQMRGGKLQEIHTVALTVWKSDGTSVVYLRP